MGQGPPTPLIGDPAGGAVENRNPATPADPSAQPRDPPPPRDPPGPGNARAAEAPAPRHDRRIALALAAATFLTLLATERSVGFVRDEGYYFTAAQSYGAWLPDLARSPRAALSDAGIVRRFEYNHEHPALMKLLYGASHLFFHDLLGVRHATAYRLPAFAAAGLLSALLYLLALRLAGRRAGLLAVLAFWLVPRHFFNAHLACFDMPVTAAWLLVVYAYLKSLDRPKWGLCCAAALGVAMSVKLNALFLPPLLFLHWLVAARRAKPTAFAAMVVVTPLVTYALWPYLWHHPIERFWWYLRFHQTHVHYPWYYLGQILREPPFPLAYPFVLTAFTVPLTTLALMVAGLVLALRRARDPAWLCVAMNALWPILIIAWPTVPHFGGVKHWLPAMPFLALCAGAAIDLAATRAAQALNLRPALAAYALGVAALLPGLWATAHIHPYGTSAYSELAGGLPGAASLGMQRQFWSNNVTGVLDWLNTHVPRGGRVYFHEVNWESYRAYQDDGMLRQDIAYAAGPAHADYVAYQHHQEFRDAEFETWRELGTSTPAAGLYLDGTAQVVVYARPGLPGAPDGSIP